VHSLRNRMVLFVIVGLMGPMAMGVSAEGDATGRGQPFAYLVIDSNEVHLGEPFAVVLLVEAPQGVVKADFSALRDVSTRFVSSQSGRSVHGVRYELHYAFVARRSGKLALPALEVSVGNETLKTQAVDLQVLEPEQTDALGLDISLSKERCYVGEPIELSIACRIDLDLSLVSAVDLHIPVLDDQRFEVFDRAQAIDASTKGAVGLPVGNRRVIAQGSTHKLGAKEFTTLTFTKVIVPRQAGVIEIDRGSVYCAVTAGKTEDKQNQYPSYFDNDFFERDIEGKYKRCYALSEGLRLEVEALPEADRPAGFYGLVNAGIEIDVMATPVQVAVGAPITLELRMRSREYLENLELRPLCEQTLLTSDFAIPHQRPLFAYDGDAKVFTESLRPVRSDIETIGTIEVPYFDTDLGQYVVAQSKPVAIEVLGGGAETETGNAQKKEASAAKLLLITHVIGIAVVFGVGLIVGMGLFGAVAKKRQTITSRSRDINAYAEFKQALAGASDTGGGEANVHERVYTALRTFLGARLGITPHTLVCNEAIRRLRSMGVDAPILERLAQVFSECEVYRFGQCYTNDKALDSAAVGKLAETCTEDIDRCLDTRCAVEH
jgi:hypothetical protein